MEVQKERLYKMSTSQLNKILVEAQDKHQPPGGTGKPFHIYYGTQVRSEPPTLCFIVMTPNWDILLTCAIWRIKSGKSIHFWALLSDWF